MTHVIGLVLVAIGCAVALAATLGALVVRGDVFVRLHFVTPVTSLAGPLVAVGLSVESGQPFVVSELLVIALLLFVAGPVLESATGRVTAQNRGIIPGEQPE